MHCAGEILPSTLAFWALENRSQITANPNLIVLRHDLNAITSFEDKNQDISKLLDIANQNPDTTLEYTIAPESFMFTEYIEEEGMKLLINCIVLGVARCRTDWQNILPEHVVEHLLALYERNSPPYDLQAATNVLFRLSPHANLLGCWNVLGSIGWLRSWAI